MNGTEIAPAHRRLSRETRNLLIAACVALVALWILARVRFPDQPVSPNPISPVLTQMSALPMFAELASEVGRVRSRVAGTVVVLPVPGPGRGAQPPRRVALRVRPDAAVTLLAQDALQASTHLDVIVADRGSGLAVVPVTPAGSALAPVPWAPVQLDAPRFLMMTTVSANGFALQPVFVGALAAVRSPAWSGPVWVLPPGANIPMGALLFTNEGELVGVSVDEGGWLAIVPGETLLADASRLLDRGHVPAGLLGIEAQALTDLVAGATRADAGVVVAWVAPDGPAARHIRPGDVIESLNAGPVVTLRDWEVRSRRVAAGETVTLDIRRGGERLSPELTAAPADDAPEPSLGLTLRFVMGVGSEVVRVEPRSVAEGAGLTRGDIITVIGTEDEPTPAQIRLAFAATEETTPLLVAFTRGDAHHVTALAR